MAGVLLKKGSQSMAFLKSQMVKPQAVNINKKTTRCLPQPPYAPLPRKTPMVRSTFFSAGKGGDSWDCDCTLRIGSTKMSFQGRKRKRLYTHT